MYGAHASLQQDQWRMRVPFGLCAQHVRGPHHGTMRRLQQCAPRSVERTCTSHHKLFDYCFMEFCTHVSSAVDNAFEVAALKMQCARALVYDSRTRPFLQIRLCAFAVCRVTGGAACLLESPRTGTYCPAHQRNANISSSASRCEHPAVTLCRLERLRGVQPRSRA